MTHSPIIAPVNSYFSSYSPSISKEEALKQATEMLDQELEFLIECGSHLEPKAKKHYIELLQNQYKQALGRLSELAKQSKITGENLMQVARGALEDLNQTVHDFAVRGEVYAEEKGSVHERLDDFDRHLHDSNPLFEDFDPTSPRDFSSPLRHPFLDEPTPSDSSPYSNMCIELETTAIGAVVQEWVNTAEIFKRPIRNQLVEQVTTQGNQILKELQDLGHTGMDHLRRDHLELSLVKLKMSGLLFLKTLPDNPLDQEQST